MNWPKKPNRISFGKSKVSFLILSIPFKSDRSLPSHSRNNSRCGPCRRTWSGWHSLSDIASSRVSLQLGPVGGWTGCRSPEVSQFCISLAVPTDADVEAAVRFATAVKASPAATAGDIKEAVAYEAQVVTAGKLMSGNPWNHWNQDRVVLRNTHKQMRPKLAPLDPIVHSDWAGRSRDRGCRRRWSSGARRSSLGCSALRKYHPRTGCQHCCLQRSDSSQQRKHGGDRHSPQPHVCRSSVGHEVQQQGF